MCFLLSCQHFVFSSTFLVSTSIERLEKKTQSCQEKENFDEIIVRWGSQNVTVASCTGFPEK
jgi:hypothetical protein